MWEKAWVILHDYIVPGLGWVDVAVFVFVLLVGIILRIVGWRKGK
jgi:hypothetical protein